MSQTHAPEATNRTRLIVAAVALVLVIGLVVFAFSRSGGDQVADPTVASPASVGTTAHTEADDAATDDEEDGVEDADGTDEAVPAGTTEGTDADEAADAGADAGNTHTDPAYAECTDVSQGFVPNRFTIEALGADENVIALDLDEQGNIAAPPFDQPRTASWWSGGPMPGDDQGKAVMSIHTYNPSLPPALGNEMYEGGRSQLQPGSLIKLYGSNGQVMCYEYTDDRKVWVSDYDPDSDIMVDFEGDHELVIVICWDYDDATRDWDSRILFYGDPVVPAA